MGAAVWCGGQLYDVGVAGWCEDSCTMWGSCIMWGQLYGVGDSCMMWGVAVWCAELYGVGKLQDVGTAVWCGRQLCDVGTDV